MEKNKLKMGNREFHRKGVCVCVCVCGVRMHVCAQF